MKEGQAMPRYRVTTTIVMTYSETIEVDAGSEDAAGRMASDAARDRPFHDLDRQSADVPFDIEGVGE